LEHFPEYKPHSAWLNSTSSPATGLASANLLPLAVAIGVGTFSIQSAEELALLNMPGTQLLWKGGTPFFFL